MTAVGLVIGLLAVLSLVIYRQLMLRRVGSSWRIVLILAVLGLIETVLYFKDRHIDAVIIAEIGVSPVRAAAFGLARAAAARNLGDCVPGG